MAIPVLQKDGTRIMRVTLTLTNRTGAPQATRAWRLAATADGVPAELVEWPAAKFRGVPDAQRGPVGRVPRGDPGAGAPRAGAHHRRARRRAPRRARGHPVISGAPGSAGAAPGRPG